MTNSAPANNRKARNDESSAARRGLGNVDLMHKPEGMSQAQFTQLQQKVRGMLAGAIGLGYLDQQDYEKAATYLQQAVAAEPQSARYNYGLAQAILSASNGNNADAYWLLAKAVSMAKGTAYEQQITRDALAKYKENGGSGRCGTSFLLRLQLPMPTRPNRTWVRQEIVDSHSQARPLPPAPHQTALRQPVHRQPVQRQPARPQAAILQRPTRRHRPCQFQRRLPIRR